MRTDGRADGRTESTGGQAQTSKGRQTDERQLSGLCSEANGITRPTIKHLSTDVRLAVRPHHLRALARFIFFLLKPTCSCGRARSSSVRLLASMSTWSQCEGSRGSGPPSKSIVSRIGGMADAVGGKGCVAQ